jgi:Na+/melibiose symporter-like transporter
VIQAISLGIIHIITRFDPKASTQALPAQWGIVFGMFAVPAFLYIIGFLFMWKVYDLKPDKVQSNKQRLKELKL